jgi:hypothetical protein
VRKIKDEQQQVVQRVQELVTSLDEAMDASPNHNFDDEV